MEIKKRVGETCILENSKRSPYYKQTEVKYLIDKTKGTKNNLLMQAQAIQLGLKNKEIDILTKQNKHLRQQISELRQQLEVAYAASIK